MAGGCFDFSQASEQRKAGLGLRDEPLSRREFCHSLRTRFVAAPACTIRTGHRGGPRRDDEPRSSPTEQDALGSLTISMRPTTIGCSGPNSCMRAATGRTNPRSGHERHHLRLTTGMNSKSRPLDEMGRCADCARPSHAEKHRCKIAATYVQIEGRWLLLQGDGHRNPCEGNRCWHSC